MKTTIFGIVVYASASNEFCSDESTLLQGRLRTRHVKTHQPQSSEEFWPTGYPAFGQPSESTRSAPSSKLAKMSKLLLDEDMYGAIGGRCMDGSMSGYYYGRPVVQADDGTLVEGSSTTWVIEMEGGGSCADPEKCQCEACKTSPNFCNATLLGLSKKCSGEGWAAEQVGNGILSGSPHDNPDFHNTHRVRIPYCTEDLHSGQVTIPTNGCPDGDDECVDQWGYFFSGHLNFKHHIHHILSNEPESRNMEKVLFAGTSAGGAGVMFNCDFLQNFLDNVRGALGMNHVEVSCAPVAAWFLPGFTADNDDFRNAPSTFVDWMNGVTTDWELSSRYTTSLWQQRLTTECTAWYESEGEQDQAWMCAGVTTLYPLINRRMYVVNYPYDYIWLRGNLGVSGLKLPHGESGEVHGTCDEQAFMAYVGNAMKKTATEMVTNKTGDQGLFLASCYDHTQGLTFRHSHQGKAVHVRSYNSLEGVGDWFHGRGQLPPFLVDDCESSWAGPCNSECHMPVVRATGCCASKMEELCGDDSAYNSCLQCAKRQKFTLQYWCNEEEVYEYCSTE